MKELLREHGGKHSLLGAVFRNMLEDVAELIKEGTDVNQPGGSGVTPLLIASGQRNKAMVALLLASKADVNPAHDLGTPLEVAQRQDEESWPFKTSTDLEIVDLLKAHGACEGAQSLNQFPTLQDRLEWVEYRCS